MTRRRLAALVAAVALALPFLQPAVAQAAEPVPPAEHLAARVDDMGNGYYRIAWVDAQGAVYDLGEEGRIPAPRPVPGIAIPVVYGDDVPGMIRSAARRWGVDGERMVRIASCETGGTFDPAAYNRRSGASGIFQAIPSTWRNTPQGRAGMSVFDPAANVEAGMWLMKHYGPGQWECKA